MKRAIQKLVVGAALRVVHAALVELRRLDPYVAKEFEALPVGMSYAIHTGHGGPSLYVQWDGRRLQRPAELPHPRCELRMKALALSFRMFTGQIGLAQGYAQHAFTMAGEIADVMRLARLVNHAEAYLFPSFITRRFLSVRPTLAASPLRMYAAIAIGFLKGKYT